MPKPPTEESQCRYKVYRLIIDKKRLVNSRSGLRQGGREVDAMWEKIIFLAIGMFVIFCLSILVGEWLEKRNRVLNTKQFIKKAISSVKRPNISQSFLPSSLEEQCLRDLRLGETVFTVPWAMYANKSGVLWLLGNYTYDYVPGGTAQMAITRDGEGFHVNISRCRDFRWAKKGSYSMGRIHDVPVASLNKFSKVMIDD